RVDLGGRRIIKNNLGLGTFLWVKLPFRHFASRYRFSYFSLLTCFASSG
ncbi:16214_t:CDS:1, partial [Dentiscutata heterogama]